MRRWSVVACALWCVVGGSGLWEGEDHKTDLRTKDASCINCEKRHIVSVNQDFNKLETDPELKHHVSSILDRLKTFKIPVHPRIRIFYELLKVGMSEYAHRTADSLYVPDKYNVRNHTARIP